MISPLVITVVSPFSGSLPYLLESLMDAEIQFAIRMKTETLPVAIFLNLSGGNLDKALAAATILIIISIIGLFAFEYIGRKNKKYVKK